MSLLKAITDSTVRNPSKVAIACGDASVTYAELDRLTLSFANNLLADGAEPGHRVSIHLQNGIDLVLACIGCLRAGCVIVPINTRLKGREIDYILRHSGSAFYVGEPELYSAAAPSCPALSSLERYLTQDSTAPGVRPFHHLLRPNAAPLAAPDASSLAAIIYTSGTTANPKGVMHSNTTLHEAALVMRGMGLDDQQVVLVMSSMAHLIGLALLTTSALANGATTVLTRPFDFNGALEAFVRWRCTFTLALPVLLHGLLEAQRQAPCDVASGRLFFGGGDSVSPALQNAFERSFPPICEAHGTTEAAPIFWNRPGEVRIGSIGKPVSNAAVRLVHRDNSEAAQGEVGEIWVQAPHLMIGYWHDPEATAIACRDGWFRTGDLAYRDPDGYYWFAGRTKEVIIHGGSNISPQEVEAALYEHPAVAEAGVIGQPDAVWGEVVVAHVALRQGARLDEAELIDFARCRLADYKVPRRVIFHTELPRNPTGKIQRRALRDQSASLVPPLYQQLKSAVPRK
ncbi:MAG: acyl--CoA ligase [Bryobacterales bacterium]|nr:acyl--CoA ligase [Bryobacterales bacterium]